MLTIFALILNNLWQQAHKSSVRALFFFVQGDETMTAKELLVSRCNDIWFDWTDPNIQKALGLYAERISRNVNGYSMEELHETLVGDCGIATDIAERMEAIVSNISFYLSFRDVQADSLDD